MDMFLVLFGLKVVRDGIPQLVCIVPLTGWYDTAAVRAILYLSVFSHGDAFLLQPVS